MTLSPPPLALVLLLSLASLGTGCRPSSGLREAARLQDQAAQQEQVIATLHAQSDAMGDLGAYDHPRPAQLDQLRDHVHQAREAHAQLVIEKQQIAQEVEALLKTHPAPAAGQAR